MTDYTKDLVFFELSADIGTKFLNGRKAEDEGFYYRSLDINKFAEQPEKIPEKAVQVRRPSLNWIRKYMYDPRKTPIVKQDLPGKTSANLYNIHDNGGVPYIVYVSINKVSVYGMPKMGYVWEENWSPNFDDNIGYYSELVVQYDNPVNVLVGKDFSNELHDGNTILVQVSPRKYVYIGESIYSFVIADQIDTYFSTIGNSDVPYPVALSKKNAYFMLDKVVLPRTTFPELKTNESFADAYGNFYELKKVRKPKFRNVKIIEKRRL